VQNRGDYFSAIFGLALGGCPQRAVIDGKQREDILDRHECQNSSQRLQVRGEWGAACYSLGINVIGVTPATDRLNATAASLAAFLAQVW
jgi:hypothetical protein